MLSSQTRYIRNIYPRNRTPNDDRDEKRYRSGRTDPNLWHLIFVILRFGYKCINTCISVPNITAAFTSGTKATLHLLPAHFSAHRESGLQITVSGPGIRTEYWTVKLLLIDVSELEPLNASPHATLL